MYREKDEKDNPKAYRCHWRLIGNEKYITRQARHWRLIGNEKYITRQALIINIIN